MNIDPETVISLYKKLVLIKHVEEQIAEKYSEREMRCPVHLSLGQEAIAVGVCQNLANQDIVYSTHRCHAHYLAKGGNLNRMLAEIYGKATGCCHGVGGSMHLIDVDAGFFGATPIVGNSLPIAVGAAFANKLKGNNLLTVVFLGDGTVEEGVFHESLNFASLHRLRVLFVCENNDYSVYTPLSLRQPKRKIINLAEAHNIITNQSDGRDVVRVFEVTQKIIGAMKKSNKPGFIEFLSYRVLEHCGPNSDDHLEYRNQRDIDYWSQRDSLTIIEAFILGHNIATTETLKLFKADVVKKVSSAFDFAQQSEFPRKEALHENIYKS